MGIQDKLFSLLLLDEYKYVQPPASDSGNCSTLKSDGYIISLFWSIDDGPDAGLAVEAINTVEIASSRFRAFPESISCRLFASGVLSGLFSGARGVTQLKKIEIEFLGWRNFQWAGEC